ncbi:MAG: hypothetical protein ACK56I_02545, partial [bacterium]
TRPPAGDSLLAHLTRWLLLESHGDPCCINEAADLHGVPLVRVPPRTAPARRPQRAADRHAGPRLLCLG